MNELPHATSRRWINISSGFVAAALVLSSCGVDDTDRATLAAIEDAREDDCAVDFRLDSFSFEELIQPGVAWVRIHGMSGEPFPSYDDYVQSYYRDRVLVGQTGDSADRMAEALDQVSYQRVALDGASVVRPGVNVTAEYRSAARTLVARSEFVEAVQGHDSMVVAIAQSFGEATAGDLGDVDFIEAVAIPAEDGSVTFPGLCEHREYSDILSQIAQGSDLASDSSASPPAESDTLERLLTDDAFANQSFVDASPDRGADAWAARNTRERSLDEPTVSETVRKQLHPVRFEFALPQSLTRWSGSLCVLTSEGWAGCTTLDATDPSGPEGGLAPITLPVPVGSWVELYYTDLPTFSELAQLSRPLARLGSPVGGGDTILVELHESIEGAADASGLAGTLRYVDRSSRSMSPG